MFRVSTSQLVDGVAGNAIAIPIASTGVKYSKAINCSFAQYFSLSYQLASSGSPDVQIDLEESVDGNPPLIEGAASTNFIVPAAETSIETDLTTKVWNMSNMGPLTARWLRLKFTGKNSNPSDTTLSGYIHLQEQID